MSGMLVGSGKDGLQISGLTCTSSDRYNADPALATRRALRRLEPL